MWWMGRCPFGFSAGLCLEASVTTASGTRAAPSSSLSHRTNEVVHYRSAGMPNWCPVFPNVLLFFVLSVTLVIFKCQTRACTNLNFGTQRVHRRYLVNKIMGLLSFLLSFSLFEKKVGCRNGLNVPFYWRKWSQCSIRLGLVI
jgi:hypothetical protein